MTNAKEDWTEAAAILQRAHDILLEEGVSCAGTGLLLKDERKIHDLRTGTTWFEVGGSPCLWHAIAQGAGMAWHEFAYFHQSLAISETPRGLASRAVWDQFVPGHTRYLGPTTGWNDRWATEDQVFDVLVEGRKYCEEQAGKL